MSSDRRGGTPEPAATVFRSCGRAGVLRTAVPSTGPLSRLPADRPAGTATDCEFCGGACKQPEDRVSSCSPECKWTRVRAYSDNACANEIPDDTFAGRWGPRWTPEIRPVVDGAKPASGRAAPSASLVPRSMVTEQVRPVDVGGADAGDTTAWPRRRSCLLAPKRDASSRGTRLRTHSLGVQARAPASRPAREHVGVMK